MHITNCDDINVLAVARKGSAVEALMLVRSTLELSVPQPLAALTQQSAGFTKSSEPQILGLAP
ncbi:hypothetical protein GCM10027046_14140 [Uliginosibacterium flavum]|uniref:Uncharacterized protein n=1 Tax=Uliginosibacterium flavum TaxID=1396831 RepID=A0ABV2TQJ4_9RHOO